MATLFFISFLFFLFLSFSRNTNRRFHNYENHRYYNNPYLRNPHYIEDEIQYDYYSRIERLIATFLFCILIVLISFFFIKEDKAVPKYKDKKEMSE